MNNHLQEAQASLGNVTWGTAIHRLGPGSNVGLDHDTLVAIQCANRTVREFAARLAEVTPGLSNAGYTYSQKAWQAIKRNAATFWKYPYDWDKSLYHLYQLEAIPHLMLVPYMPRLRHQSTQKGLTIEPGSPFAAYLSNIPTSESNAYECLAPLRIIQQDARPTRLIDGQPCLHCDFLGFDKEFWEKRLNALGMNFTLIDT